MLSVNGLLLQVDKLNVGKIVSRIQMAVTTDVGKVNVKSTCRICLMENKQEDLFCLFTSNKMFKDLTIATALSDCFGVKLVKDQTLPGNVCIKCASSTLQSHMFKKCLIKCQETLEKNRKKHEIENQSPEEIKHEAIKLVTNTELPAEANVENVDSNIMHQSKETVDIQEIFEDHNYTKQYTNSVIKSVAEDVTSVIENIDNNCGNDIKVIQDEINISEVNLQTQTATKRTSSNRKKWWSKNLGPPYECKICNKNFGIRFKTFYVHVKSHSSAKFECKFCGKKFSHYKLRIHLRTHTKEKPYHCNQCSASFAIKANLQRHFYRHTGEKPYICDICGKALSQLSSLKCHKQLHEGETRHVCIYCGKTFTSDNSYSSHVYYYHKDNDKGNVILSEDKSLICEICERSFKTQSSLTTHLRMHNSENYYCDICNKIFRSHFNYSIHQFWHEAQMLESINMPIICKFCEEIFVNKNELIVHILKHTEKLYLCTICNKSHLSRRQLKLHSCPHIDKMPFRCNTCNKVFNAATNLKQHVKIHLKDKPYKCTVCERKFVQQQHLSSHMLTHTGVKKHICPYCGKAFALNGNLTVHKRRHTGETPFICDICGKGFYDSSTKKKHRQTVHKATSTNKQIKKTKVYK